jgi:hypothetical protein
LKQNGNKNGAITGRGLAEEGEKSMRREIA